MHSATAFNLSPGLTEVVLFGGTLTFISHHVIANTTVLRFGELHKMDIVTAKQEARRVILSVGRSGNLHVLWMC